jgi:hypothetical protein
MDDNERAIVRFGMTPLWTLKAGFDGRDSDAAWPDIEHEGEAGRLLTLALFDCAKASGGMVC